MAYKRILVPVDGSATALKGLDAALRLAKDSGAKLRLLHVVEEYAAFTAPDAGVNIAPILDALKAGGRKTLAKAEQRVRAAGLKADSAMLENFGGRIADLIVEQAKRWKADLIVMGTHGRRGVQRVLVGSDADLVVRYSPVPVLLVPARGRGR